jgi:predicted nucleic acid-binding protein
MDVCCLNRPFDDRSNDRISLESEAILKILYRCQEDDWHLVGSDAIELEISKIIDESKRQNVFSLYKVADSVINFNEEIEIQALIYQDYGIKVFDSVHLASAEFSKVDIFLTTDKKLINKAKQINGLLIKVENPAIWYMEVVLNEFTN